MTAAAKSCQAKKEVKGVEESNEGNLMIELTRIFLEWHEV